MNKKKITWIIILICVLSTAIQRVANTAYQSNNTNTEISRDISSSNEISNWTFFEFASDWMSIQYTNITVVEGKAILDFSLSSIGQQKYITVDLKILGQSEKSLLHEKQMFLYNFSTNMLSTNNSVYGKFHLFQSPETLQHSSQEITVLNYNGHQLKGIISKDTYKTYVVGETYFIAYRSVKFSEEIYPGMLNSHSMNYEKNNGILIGQPPIAITYGFFGLDLLSCGGYPFDLSNTDFIFDSVESGSITSTGIDDGEKDQFPYIIIIIISIVGLSFFSVYRTINKRR